MWWGHTGKAIRKPRVTEKAAEGVATLSERAQAPCARPAVLLQQPSRLRQHPPEGTATQQVQMDVIDFLAGVGPAVQDEPVSLLVDPLFLR